MSEKIYLKDYQAPNFSVESIHLTFHLDEENTRVKSTARYRKLKEAPLVLNGVNQKLVAVKLDGTELRDTQYEVTTDHLKIQNLPEEFILEIISENNPSKNTALDGLYISRGIFCTQCEAEGFRKITYFIDRPDVMTKYSVDIIADKRKFPVLLSNGDRISQKDLGDGRHQVSWRDPFKKPSYLFALVAGDLGVIKDHYTTMSGRKVNLEIYAAHGKQDRCHHAMTSIKKSMKWDEETFGLEYDLNDYMIVAIDDFNMGAMENKGLNIFNSRLVFADTQSATDYDYHSIESVVAHEYFHNWTGNRVTCQNWFQLSLKEGLTVYRDQEFSSDVGSRAVQRIEDVNRLRNRQFAEDAGPNAHPVRPESCMSVDNFYTATIYEKGAEVIRMMEKLVGKKGFRLGMDTYFARHDGQAVTTDDFAAAISESNHKDFSQFKRWYSQAGTPVVEVDEKYDSNKKEYHLSLKQSCPPTTGQEKKEAFHIPLMIGLLSQDSNNKGSDLKLDCDKVSKNSDGVDLIELREMQETYVFKNIQTRPVLSLNRQFSAPINLKWKASDEDLVFAMKYDSDSFNRREASQILAMNELQKLIAAKKSGETPKVNSVLIEAFSAVLKDTKIDPAFKAKMLQLPDVSVMAQKESVIDAEAFDFAYLHLQKSLAQALKIEFREYYLTLHALSTRDLSALAIGQRDLKNQILFYLNALEDKDSAQLALGQFKSALTMTDKLAAMNALEHFGAAEATTALDEFYHEWKNDSLVLNKWLSVQANSRRPDTFENVKRLVKHPSFDINNPNNVYALLGIFGQNIARFHDSNVNAYAFMCEQIALIDAKNPQVAARLCGSFTFVKKLTAENKARATSEIKKVLAVPQLSPNSKELLQTCI